MGISGLPEDRFINDFAFTLPAAIADQAEADAYRDDIESAFYNNSTTGDSIASLVLSRVVERTGSPHTVAFYDKTGHLDGSVSGSPAFVSELTIDSQAATPINCPEAAQGVISWHADLDGVLEKSGSTRPRARRRARVFVGPLDGLAIGFSGSGMFLSLDAQAALVEAGSALMSAWDGSSAPQLCVWSRTDAAMRPVVGGFVDNGIDTQRRRQQKPNGRTTF